MKRRLFLISFCLLFASSLFGADNRKLDNKIKERITKGRKTEKVRVIVQRFTPASKADFDDVRGKGGKVGRELKRLRAYVAEMTLDQIEKMSDNPNVKNISLDEPVRAHAGEFNVASGAALATQTYGVTGAGIGVAIVDSGIASHPDLQNVVKSVDFVDPARNGGYDGFGHGTHVAGIVGGSGSSSGGTYKGAAPGVKLVDLRVLNDNGGGYTSDVMAAIEWAVDNRNNPGNNGQPMNIRVINLSLGHRPYESTATDPLTVMSRYAVQNGVVVVAAAGNYGKDVNGNTTYGGITSPGNERSVITVGAMTTWGTDSRSDDTVATYSSRGPTVIEGLMKPDVVAPGSQVVAALSPNSAIANAYPQLKVGSSYLKLSGTSMAAPVVSGAVAMMLQQNPSMTPNAVKAALMFTAEQRTELPVARGAGYVNIAGAVNLAANINTAAPAGQYWILNAGLGLNYSNVIGGFPATWSQTIVWEEALSAGNPIFYNEGAWSQTYIWGTGSTSTATTIVWETSLADLTNGVLGQTIVWEEALTIVWEEP